MAPKSLLYSPIAVFPGPAARRSERKAHTVRQELAYILKGWVILEAQGKPPVTLKVGEAFHTVVGEVHNVKNASASASGKALAFCTAKKGTALEPFGTLRHMSFLRQWALDGLVRDPSPEARLELLRVLNTVDAERFPDVAADIDAAAARLAGLLPSAEQDRSARIRAVNDWAAARPSTTKDGESGGGARGFPSRRREMCRPGGFGRSPHPRAVRQLVVRPPGARAGGSARPLRGSQRAVSRAPQERKFLSLTASPGR